MNEQNKMASAMKGLSQKVRTENGALSFSVESIENPWVKVFYQLSSFRHRFVKPTSLKKRHQSLLNNEDLVFIDFKNALDAAKGTDFEKYGIRLALFVRDIGKGAGERSLGRLMLAELANRRLITPERLACVLGEEGYGRWDDLIEIAQLTKNRAFASELDRWVIEQLKKDIETLETSGERAQLSLLAKWMPSIATSSSQTRRLARHFIRLMKTDNRGYRQTLSKLRAQLKIVEQKICSRNWSEINYEQLPSKAALRYAGLFLEKDAERYRAFLDRVQKGDAKVNAATLTAPEIIAKLRQERVPDGQAQACEVLWDALPEIKLNRNLLPVCDVSGSMWTQVGSLQAIDVSLELSLYLAQSNTGPFKNLVMSFNNDSRITDLSKYGTLLDKWKVLEQYEGYNTNIESALNQILCLAQEYKVSQEELPALVFFSDMEFDAMNCNQKSTKTIFEVFQGKFAEIGLKMPQVVFWNICNRTNSVPILENELGMVLCSGFSQQIMEAVLACDFPTPWAMLKNTLESARYKGVLD